MKSKEVEIEKFKNSAERLVAKGMTQMMLHQILDDIAPVSPVVITPDYRIVLPSFENKEVELTYLQKTLYFFFLRYPEGVILKHMQEHNVELYNIYAQLNTSAKEDKMRQTIKDLTNPLNNRLHENIARIKSAFLKVMDQYTAQKYIVDGAKGELYGIALDRELVEWQE